MPEDIVLITPAGKAHRGKRHESGAMEMAPGCHTDGGATDVNQIVPLKDFKGAAKRNADLCGRCFPD